MGQKGHRAPFTRNVARLLRIDVKRKRSTIDRKRRLVGFLVSPFYGLLGPDAVHYVTEIIPKRLSETVCFWRWTRRAGKLLACRVTLRTSVAQFSRRWKEEKEVALNARREHLCFSRSFLTAAEKREEASDVEEHVEPNAATVASIFFLFIRVALACRDKAPVGGNSRTPSAPCEKTAYRYMAYTGRIERLSRVDVSAEQRREERYRRFHVLLPPGYYVSFPSNVRRSIEAKPNVRASSR